MKNKTMNSLRGFSGRGKSRGLVQEIVDHLSEQIHKGVVRPGDKLPTESEIVRTQGVSRTVVREAISQIQAIGLVETRHGIGTFVREVPMQAGLSLEHGTRMTMHDVLAMLELRTSVEIEAAGLTALRRSEEQLQALREALDALERVVERGEQGIDEDFQFHLQIAHATGNHYFPDFMKYLGPAAIPRVRVHSVPDLPQDRPYLDRINREHEEIYAAIARRDPEATRAAMRTHLSNSRERLRLRLQKAEEAKSSLR